MLVPVLADVMNSILKIANAILFFLNSDVVCMFVQATAKEERVKERSLKSASGVRAKREKLIRIVWRCA